jgi:DNA-directed RNA polymerase specialized sigma24 family protein
MPELLHERGRGDYGAEYVRLQARLAHSFRLWFPALRGQEDDFYNDAWTELLDDEEIHDDAEARLRRTLYTRGLDEMRRRGRRPAGMLDADDPDVADEAFERTEENPEEHALLEIGARDAQAILLEHLTGRQQRVLKLHWGWGLRVKDVASALRLSPRTVRREIEDAAAVVAENASWLTPCTQGARRSLVKAYVLGLLSDRRAAKALAHLEECASCRALRDQMEETLRGAAALIPVGVIADPPAADPSALERLVQGADVARESLIDAATGTKHQVAALVGRAPAPDATAQVAASGGLRGSGAMLATAASCLVVGGGTVTYCAVEGIPDPIRSALPGVPDKADERKPDKNDAAAEQPPASPAPPVLPAPAPEAPPPAASQGSTAGSTEPQPAPAEPAPSEREFGFEKQAAPSSSPPPVAPAPQPDPTPAPAPSEREFGFEQ